MTVKQSSERFEKSLAVHGFSFQYGVAEYFRRMEVNQEFNWRVAAIEFPVSVQGRDTRIDLILSRPNQQIMIVAECKRANPALADWCFARTDYPCPESLRDWVYLETIQRNKTADFGFEAISDRVGRSEHIYHLGQEVRTHEQGDKSGHGRGAIEDAVSQVLRGMNGLVEEFLSRHDIPFPDRLSLLPVVFTTADLWVTDTPLSDADPLSGELPLETELRKLEWLYYQYNQSKSLKHGLHVPAPPELKEILVADYTRTVAIVSASGMRRFFREGIGFI